MRNATTATVFALLLSGVLMAQDAKVTTGTDTKVKADNGQVVTVTGCVAIGGATNFMLTNITAERAARAKTSKDAPRPLASYPLVERDGVDLGQYIDHRVELTGVFVAPATKGDNDDKIKIKGTTGVEANNRPDTKSPPTTTVKVERGNAQQFLVASVKNLAQGCDR